MKLTLVVAEDCPACIRAKKSLLDFCHRNQNADLKIKNISEYKSNNLSIVPALFVDEELFSYGEIDPQQLTRLTSK